MTDPSDIQTIEFLRRKTGLEPKVYITPPGDLKEALRRYHAELEDDLKVIQDETGVSGGDLKKAAEELPTINIVNINISIIIHSIIFNFSRIYPNIVGKIRMININP